MKSQVDSILHVAEGLLLEDFLLAYPALKSKFAKDLGRLALCCRNRGLAFFTLDLPALESQLLTGLESGRLILEGPCSRKVSPKVRVPRLFSGLWLRIFDKNACLKEDADVNAILFLRQILCLGKKIAVDCSTERVKQSVEKYYDIEQQLRPPSRNWSAMECDFGDEFRYQLDDVTLYRDQPMVDSDQVDFSPDTENAIGKSGLRRLLGQVQQVADLVSESIGLFDPHFASAQCGLDPGTSIFRHGPGAVAERKWSWTEKSNFIFWPAKLERVFPYRWFGRVARSCDREPVPLELASLLTAVPKTAKGPRLIASEPAAHQYCQQGIARFLVHRLKEVFGTNFIDFRDQAKSGRLVLSASLDRKLCTVDLSDASDRLSCWTIERIFRRNPSLLRAMHATRTRGLSDNVFESFKFLQLKKFATQGTALTFPVQSIVFWCIAIGVCLDGDITWHNIWQLKDKVRIFGDDIIIPRYGYARLIRVMEALQLKVNEGKSFVRGHFRESCGVDGYKGYDVTPVKPTTFVAGSPADCQALIDTSNNLFMKGFWYASKRLVDAIPVFVQRNTRIVGLSQRGFSGFTSFSGSDESHLATRWNSRLHRNDVRVWGLYVPTREVAREGHHLLLDFASSKYSHEQARTVSTIRDVRESKSRLTWESSSPDSRRVVAYA